MSYLAYVGMLALATALERTWPGCCRYRAGPRVVLATVIAIALSGGPVAGCFAGLVGGLLPGSAEGSWLGLLSHTWAWNDYGLMRGHLLAERVLVASVVALIASPVAALIGCSSRAPAPGRGCCRRWQRPRHGAGGGADLAAGNW